jgi:hypothetical protein
MTDPVHWHDRKPLMSPADITPSIGGMGVACLKVSAHDLVTFSVGSVVNIILFNAKGVLIFMACLVLAKPVLDLPYFPIQMLIVDKVSEIEHRNLYTYIFNHELGLFAARFIGCGLFILLTTYVLRVAAPKLALPTISGIPGGTDVGGPQYSIFDRKRRHWALQKSFRNRRGSRP